MTDTLGTAVLTGATSGIGEQVAHLLASRVCRTSTTLPPRSPRAATAKATR
ncbi:hypothetical protein [Frondihabitans sp. PAMC 28766]|uniref:hypothetical protein n=1 Tax=Frondihabitans sp. PAMC 28766 TaxID=1795630 RepID=UPI0012FF6D2A|nr:hypothetical protein [Frondihabitans sp. PAMC 28766]